MQQKFLKSYLTVFPCGGLSYLTENAHKEMDIDYKHSSCTEYAFMYNKTVNLAPIRSLVPRPAVSGSEKQALLVHDH